MRRVAVVLLLSFGACATTDTSPKERCERDARARYRQCLNPTFIPEGEPLNVVSGAESQNCRSAYQQALGTCGGGDVEIPLFPIGTSTGTSRKP